LKYDGVIPKSYEVGNVRKRKVAFKQMETPHVGETSSKHKQIPWKAVRGNSAYYFYS
jgi:hypothetical protein